VSSVPGPNDRPAGGWPPPAAPWSPPSDGYPPGYGWPHTGPGPYPQPGYPPSSPGYPPRGTKSKALWLSVIAGAVAVVIAVMATGLYVVHRNSDPVKIRSLVGDFSVAVYGGDPRQMARYMCAEGAQSFLDTIEDPDTPAALETPPPFDVSDIEVKGDVASAKLTFERTGVQTMYFRKEAGKWTVCAAAEDQM
jgi:hypothetical protein